MAMRLISAKPMFKSTMAWFADSYEQLFVTKCKIIGIFIMSYYNWIVSAELYYMEQNNGVTRFWFESWHSGKFETQTKYLFNQTSYEYCMKFTNIYIYI